MNFHPIEKPTEPGWWWRVTSSGYCEAHEVARVYAGTGLFWKNCEGDWSSNFSLGQWFGPRITQPQWEKVEMFGPQCYQHRDNVDMKTADPHTPRRFRCRFARSSCETATHFGVYDPRRNSYTVFSPGAYTERLWGEDALLQTHQGTIHPDFEITEWLDTPPEEKPSYGWLREYGILPSQLVWRDKRAEKLDLRATFEAAGKTGLVKLYDFFFDEECPQRK